MKNILLPTDFSRCSTNAIWYALDLFQGTSCTFHFLSIYKASKYTSGELMSASAGDSLHDILISESRAKLDDLTSKAKDLYREEDFYFNVITDYDLFTDSINKFLVSEKIDLIVMGTDGISDTADKIFGGHTLKVIRQVDSPVLIIPEKAEFHLLQRLLLSLDARTVLRENTFRSLLKLIGHHNFSLEILKLSDSRKDPQEQIKEEKELNKVLEKYHFAYHLVRDVTFPEAINTVTQTMKIDMNILPARKEDFLERLLGSDLSRIIYSTPVPLIILHQ